MFIYIYILICGFAQFGLQISQSKLVLSLNLKKTFCIPTHFLAPLQKVNRVVLAFISAGMHSGHRHQRPILTPISTQGCTHTLPDTITTASGLPSRLYQRKDAPQHLGHPAPTPEAYPHSHINVGMHPHPTGHHHHGQRPILTPISTQGCTAAPRTPSTDTSSLSSCLYQRRDAPTPSRTPSPRPAAYPHGHKSP